MARYMLFSATLSFLVTTVSMCFAQSVDPMASNNGLYPSATEWDGPYNVANLSYQTEDTTELSIWGGNGENRALTTKNAAAYADALKAHLEKTLRPLIEKPETWNPKQAGWYDLVWMGQGTPGKHGIDPTSGREAIMNTYSGQLLPKQTFSGPDAPTTYVQNHAVIYYNTAAMQMLGELWKNVYHPNLAAIGFPEGSIVAKVEAVTNTPATWPVVTGAASWHVFRPSTEDQAKGGDDLKPQVLEVRPLQIAVRVKDTIASPKTGWVFVAFVYDRNAPGTTVWDKFVPAGVQFGNDPDYARLPRGVPDGGALKETWVNPKAPAFIQDTLGWGGRLAGPMDVATRHNVITPSGKRYGPDVPFRASSCQSCHAAAEFPFTANLYPSPNKSFPSDGEPFLLYDPGSEEWARWFQNTPGTESLSPNIGGQGLDYDMALMFAISNYNRAMGQDAFVQERFDVH